MKSRTRSVWWNSTRVPHILGAVAFVGCAMILSFYAGTQYQSSQKADSTIAALPVHNQFSGTVPQQPMPTGAKPPKPEAFLSKTFTSPLGTYTLTVYKLIGQNKCGLIANRTNGVAVNIVTLVGVASFSCTVSDGKLASGFKKWLNDDTFLFDGDDGKTLEVNIADKSVKHL